MPPRRTPTPQSPIKTLEVVDPRWLLKAIGLALLAAIFCAYLTLCLLFHQGQWQLVLHPSRTAMPPPAMAHLGQLVHFGAAATGTPQLAGYWIPAPSNSRYATTTLLFLPGAEGSLATHAATLRNLTSIGINVFAIDYRGYGQSADIHPTQLRMQQDASTAFDYLTTTRGLQPQQIIPYGAGLGAALATQLAASHAGVPALILDAPDGDLLDRARHDPRARLVPVRLLFHERFPLASSLEALQSPKLLISYANTPPSIRAAIHAAPDPKLTVELPSPSGTALSEIDSQIITRFLDQYLSTPALATPTLQPVPSPAPARKTTR